MVPAEVIDEALGCSVRRLLEVQRERYVVVVIVGSLERREEASE